MMNTYDVELTDTFSGEANYSWVKRARIRVPELTHYGYTGSTDGSYARANRAQRREIMRRAKAAVGMTGVRGTVDVYGDTITFRPYGLLQIMFATFNDGADEEGDSQNDE